MKLVLHMGRDSTLVMGLQAHLLAKIEHILIFGSYNHDNNDYMNEQDPIAQETLCQRCCKSEVLRSQIKDRRVCRSSSSGSTLVRPCHARR